MPPDPTALSRRPYHQIARASATEALRARILDALFDAIRDQDYDLITLNTIAEAAGTTRQTVIRLFGGKDGALIALFSRPDRQIAAERRKAMNGDLHILAKQVVTDLENNGDFVLQLLRQENRIPFIRERIVSARQQHMALLRRELAPLLSGLTPSGAKTALQQVRAVTDTLFWSVLRKDMGLGAAATEALLLDLLQKIFVDALPPRRGASRASGGTKEKFR